MRQRKPVVKRKENTSSQERAYFNPKGRDWVKKRGESWRYMFAQKIWKNRFPKLIASKTIVTPLVKKTALDLSIGKDAVSAVKAISTFVAKDVKLVNTGVQTMNKFYNAQTADDVIHSRRIPTIVGANGPIAGCQTVAATVATLLKAAKPKNGSISDIKIVRTIAPWGKRLGSNKLMGVPHSIVSLKINGKRYYVDSFSSRSIFGERTLVLEKDVEKQIIKLKKSGKWKEFNDSSQSGTNTFIEFLNESRKNGADLAANLDLSQLK